MTSISRLLLVAACGAALPGCGGGLPRCPTSDAVFDTRPTPRADTLAIVPLGGMNPPAHTFPTDHIYFYVPSDRAVPVVSPGEIRINRLESVEYVNEGRTDYTVRFEACDEVFGYFHHLVGLSDALASRLPRSGSGCSEYSTGGSDVRRCSKRARIRLAAGDPVGTAGDGALAYDLGLYDTRTEQPFANPERLQEDYSDQIMSVCPVDYFEASVAEDLRSQLGSWDGSRPRTVEPRCGEIAQDIVGTMQGRWFARGRPDLPEDPHLALVHDNIDPMQPVFSVGNTLPRGPGRWTFTPAASGLVDRDFADTAVGDVYCWQMGSVGPEGFSVLAELVDETTLHLEVRDDPACGAGPWVLGSPVIFDR